MAYRYQNRRSHTSACCMVCTSQIFRYNASSSWPASVCGCSVSFVRIFCQTWNKQRCIRTSGQHRARARRMPFWPSQTTTTGAGRTSSVVVHVVLLSQPAQCQFVATEGVRATWQTRLPTLVASMRTTESTSPVGTGLGTTSQHQATCLRQVRSGIPSSAWDRLPSSQATKRCSVCALLRSDLGLVMLLLHVGQSQRCVPAAVNPRFWSFVLHVGQYRKPLCFMHK